MTSKSIITRIRLLRQRGRSRERLNLHDLAHNPELLPSFVRHSPVAMRYLELLGPLAWDRLPERDLALGCHMRPVPYAAFAAACLIKIDHQLATMGALRRYLVEHPALVWLVGFPLVRSRHYPWGFDADASLPNRRHFTRLLRTMPNQPLQDLLDSSVNLVQSELAEVGLRLGQSISLDTKHIPSAGSGQASPGSRRTIPKPTSKTATTRTSNSKATPTVAWVQAPSQPAAFFVRTAPTPTTEPLPAHTVSVGE